jgi:hypothetical protein
VEISLISLLGIEDTCMVAMRRQLSLIKEDWPYSLIVHVLGMSLPSLLDDWFSFSALMFLTLKHEIFNLLNFSFGCVQMEVTETATVQYEST